MLPVLPNDSTPPTTGRSWLVAGTLYGRVACNVAELDTGPLVWVGLKTEQLLGAAPSSTDPGANGFIAA